MSSAEPNDSDCQTDGVLEVTFGFVVASGNGAVLLEPGREVLNQVTGLIQLAVTAALVQVRDFWGNHHGFAGSQQRLDHPGLCGISLVCNERARLGVRE